MIAHDAHELGYPDGRTHSAQEVMDRLSQLKDQVMPWFWGASSVILSPFKTLALMAWATLFLFIGARLLVPLDPNRPVTLRSSVRLACFASTPILWNIIPVIGPVVAEVMILLTTITGLKKIYNINRLRASLIALFPQLLFLGILFLGLCLVGFLVFKLVLSLFPFLS